MTEERQTVYGTCEANFQEEFPGCHDSNGKLVSGKVTLIEEVTDPNNDCCVFGAIYNQKVAERIVDRLNALTTLVNATEALLYYDTAERDPPPNDSREAEIYTQARAALALVKKETTA